MDRVTAILFTWFHTYAVAGRRRELLLNPTGKSAPAGLYRCALADLKSTAEHAISG